MGAPPSETGQQLADQQEFLRQQGIELRPPFNQKEHPIILSKEAIEFVAGLQREFGPEIEQILAARKEVQKQIDERGLVEFLSNIPVMREGVPMETTHIPRDLQTRTVEITEPANSITMVINAVNSGANVSMVDFEDALSPTGDNILQGQEHVYGLVRRTLKHTKGDKDYALDEQISTLIVRPRGWHLTDKHIIVDDKRISAPLLDVGLFFFHNAEELVSKGTGVYLYLPKMQDPREAALWARIFSYLEASKNLPAGTINVTPLAEHFLFIPHRHEIIEALRGHISAANFGRWDYLYSLNKILSKTGYLSPDKKDLKMQTTFMSLSADLIIEVCNAHGIMPIGGMSALLPIKGNKQRNEEARNQVRLDKQWERVKGFKGAWVAHPALVELVRGVFEDGEPEGPPEAVNIHSWEQVLKLPEGPIRLDGLRTNISVALRYVAAWLSGVGAVSINDLMEDMATAEISRSQVWHWLHHGAILDNGQRVDADLVKQIFAEELERARGDEELKVGREKLDLAAERLQEIIFRDEMVEFLSIELDELLP